MRRLPDEEVPKDWSALQKEINELKPPENYAELQYKISCVMFINELNDLIKTGSQPMKVQLAEVRAAFLHLHSAKIKLMEEQAIVGEAYLQYYGVIRDENNNLVDTHPPRSSEETALYTQQVERYKQQIEEYDRVKDSFNDAIDALPQSWGGTLKRYGYQLLHYLKLMLAKPIAGAVIGAAIACVVSPPGIVAAAAMPMVGAIAGEKISHFIRSKLFEPNIPNIQREQRNIDSAKKKLGSAKRYQEKVKNSKEAHETKAENKEYLRKTNNTRR